MVNPHNLKILQLYESIKRTAGCTKKSIEAIVWNDLRLFAEYLGDKNFEEATTLDVEGFFSYCLNERNNELETLARKQTSLNAFYKTMIRKEYFNIKNPLDKIDPIKHNSKPRGYLTKQEFKQLIDYLQSQNDLRGLAYVLLSYSSACRINEIRQLNRDSLDYDKLQFTVLGKGERYRVCIFSQEAGEAVKRYLATRKDDNPALFLSREHKRWSKESIERFLRKAAQEAGIKQRVFPHLLRHTRAMHLLQDGVPLDIIQKILGHRNIGTTQIYAVMSIEQAQKSINDIDALNKWLDE